ncbi:BgTH12-03688 [Blumeria graminis f. sp. triticale]|uniref:Bgt-20652 n=2 Tax=Blumeria graminis TaxID=34373 RepID=A0A9X9L8V6_BLUGR|nr:BgTH12-03688 [Blumeria graminis f. sp. triticale]VCU39743.1 Bgt-20652 [Blumeria graminis f. sp. tritici]
MFPSIIATAPHFLVHSLISTRVHRRLKRIIGLSPNVRLHKGELHQMKIHRIVFLFFYSHLSVTKGDPNWVLSARCLALQ